MANRFNDSFDHYTTALGGEKWNVWNWAITAAAGRGGSAAAQNAVGTNMAKTIDAQGTWTVGFAYKVTTFAVGNFLSLIDASTPKDSIFQNGDGTLSVKNGAGTVLGTTTFSLLQNTFYFIELKVLISNAAGTVDLWINGVNRLSLAGKDTQNGGNATANVINFANVGSGALTTIDDLYVNDGTGAANNANEGDCRVVWQGPTGAGADVGWTNNGAAPSKQATLATNPPDVTKFISTSTVPDSFTATFSAPAVNGPIKALQIVFSQEKDDATACTIAPIVRHAAADNVGVAVAPSNGSYALSTQAYDVNPGTGVAWVLADITTDEFGIKRVS